MFRRWFSSRILWAVLLALVLAAPAPVMPVAQAAVPDWMAGSLCLADHGASPDDHKSPAHPAHVHCALCLTGLALGTPPTPWRLAAPQGSTIAPPAVPALAWFGPGADHPYASRAPPRIA